MAHLLYYLAPALLIAGGILLDMFLVPLVVGRKLSLIHYLYLTYGFILFALGAFALKA